MKRNKILSVALVSFLVMVFLYSHIIAAEDLSSNRNKALNIRRADIQKSSAIIVLSSDVSGEIIICDQQGSLVVELDKPFGQRIELGLEEGEYRITNILNGDIYELKIILREGDSFQLDPDELEKTDDISPAPLKETSAQFERDALLGDQIETNLYGGMKIKPTRIWGENAILIGGNIGMTFNNSFSVGFAGYGRAIAGPDTFEIDVDFDWGRPAYGGVTLEYSFVPMRKAHLKAGALLGAGNSWGRGFYIFEPGVEVVLNLSRIARVGFGVSMPFTDEDNNGLKNPIFCMSFQFGK